jgi:hypothetical protein
MGHGIRWGRDTNISPKVTALHPTRQRKKDTPPSLRPRPDRAVHARVRDPLCMTVTAPTPCPIARGPGPTMPFISRARVDGRHHYRSQGPPVESWLDAAGRAVRGSAADRPHDDGGPLQPFPGSHCRPGRRSGGSCAFPEPLRHLRGPSGGCTRRRRRQGRAHTTALVDWVAVQAGQAAGCRVSARQLAAGGQWQDARHLGRATCAVDR